MRIGERTDEIRQIVDLCTGKLRGFVAADRVGQGSGRSVMEIGRRQRDIAKGGGAIAATVGGIAALFGEPAIALADLALDRVKPAIGEVRAGVAAGAPCLEQRVP